MSIFDQLDFMQELDGKPTAWLAFGHALAGAGDHIAADKAFESGLAAKPDKAVSFSHSSVLLSGF